MYAVIETGGKQYRVELGTELAVERLDAAPGTSIDFDRVLLVADGDSAQVGTPVVVDAVVTADVLRQDRGDKVIVFKYRPKARHRAKKGHRQEQTVIRVADIRFSGRSAADEAGKTEAKEKSSRKAAQAEAERQAAADQELAARLAADAAKAQEAKAQEAKAQEAKAQEQAAPETEEKPAPKTATRKRATASKAAQPSQTEPTEAAGDTKKKPTRSRSTRTTTKKDE